MQAYFTWPKQEDPWFLFFIILNPLMENLEFNHANDWKNFPTVVIFHCSIIVAQTSFQILHCFNPLKYSPSNHLEKTEQRWGPSRMPPAVLLGLAQFVRTGTHKVGTVWQQNIFLNYLFKQGHLSVATRKKSQSRGLKTD